MVGGAGWSMYLEMPVEARRQLCGIFLALWSCWKRSAHSGEGREMPRELDGAWVTSPVRLPITGGIDHGVCAGRH
ncbi:hypothetical protein KCP78_23445 [Salmonella enterica subsp. enterica]|nr:hypothetical protein KCP78_23445 [Salmonella enterica subsp. enterica]